MPNRRSALNEIGPLIYDDDDIYVVDSDDQLDGLTVIDNAANIGRNQSTLNSSLDEEVIRRRGKRERKYNIVTRSMDPILLATRKSPVKRTHSSAFDIIKMLVPKSSSKSSSSPKTPSKRAKIAPSISSPSSASSSSNSPNGRPTRRKLNLSNNDSGFGSAPATPSFGNSNLSEKTSKDNLIPANGTNSPKKKLQYSKSSEKKRRSRRLSSLRRIL